MTDNGSAKIPPGPDPEPPERRISRFDAAGYIFQMIGEMAELSRKCEFEDLTRTLEQARDAAAQALIAARRTD